MTTDTGAKLYERTICLVLSCTRWGVSKKARMDNVTVDADKTLLHMSKRLIKSEKYAALSTEATRIRDYLRATALPSATFKSSVFLVPVEMVPMVNEELEKSHTKFNELVEAFVAEYQGDPANGVKSLPEQISEELRSQFNAMDYPPAEIVRQAFSYRWEYVSFDVPGRLATISKAIFEQEREKAAAKLTAAADDVRLVLREGMLTLVQSLVDKLQPTDDGKRRVLRDTQIEKIQKFLQVFDLKNVTDDDELTALVAKARDAMKGVDATILKDDAEARRRTLEAFEAIAAEVQPLVVNLRTRQITLVEDAA